jgi:hypothetical protein
MSFTDLASLAQARQQQQPLPPPPQPQQNEAGAPPDPRSFTQSPTNPASVATQVASIDASGGTPAGLESNEDLGSVSKTKDKTAETEPAAEDVVDAAYPPVTFPPDNYRPPAANRPPEQWGTEPGHIRMAEQYPGVAPGADMPSPALSYKELRDSGAALGRWGPPSVAEPSSQGSFLMAPFVPILDAISQGKFSRNYTVAALRGLEIRRQEALQKFEQSNQAHAQILQSYGSILRMAADGSITHQQARNMISDYANQIGDNAVLHELERNDLRGVEGWLTWQDAFHRRQLAATTQLRKVAGDADKEQRAFDALSGRRTVPGGSGGAFGIDPSQLPGRDEPEAPQTPTADQSEPLNPYESKITEGLRDANGQPLPPLAKSNILREARRRMSGDPVESPIPKGSLADAAVGQVQMALGSNIDRIARLKPSPGQDPDEFRQQQLEAIKQNNPEVAQQVDDLKNLRIDPQTFTVTGGQRRRAVDLTAQLYPGWNQGMYHAFQNVWNNGNSQESRQLEAGNRATTQAVILEAAINRLKIPEDSTIPANVWNEWKTQGYTSDPQFAALNEPLRAFAGEMVFLQTGRVNVTPVTQFLKEVPLYAGKAALRTVVRQAMIGGLHTMEQKNGVFARQTGLSGLPPATDPDAMMLYDEFARSNPNTGMFHKDAAPELKSIEPSAEDRARRPAWRTKEQEFEPMGKGEWQKLRATIEKMRKDNPNDPRLPQLMHEFGISQ